MRQEAGREGAFAMRIRCATHNEFHHLPGGYLIGRPLVWEQAATVPTILCRWSLGYLSLLMEHHFRRSHIYITTTTKDAF